MGTTAKVIGIGSLILAGILTAMLFAASGYPFRLRPVEHAGWALVLVLVCIGVGAIAIAVHAARVDQELSVGLGIVDKTDKDS